MTAKVADTVWNKMYEKLSANPTPKCSPIPPFIFLDDKETPMVVKIKAAKDMWRTQEHILSVSVQI